MENETVRFALNVWAGWAPIIYANQGFKAKKEWSAPDGKKFKVELVLIDDPIAMRDAYASGNVHIGWATVDMLPLLIDELKKDSRTMPRVFQQIDWSNGGDGIVVRENIRTVRDLRGKTIVLAQNSPSQYFALSMLVAGGVQPGEVRLVVVGIVTKGTARPLQRAAFFVCQCSWSRWAEWRGLKRPPPGAHAGRRSRGRWPGAVRSGAATSHGTTRSKWFVAGSR
jgi:ABC-type nitrate/sulfonate/bicarbonate transport system substrate-binding protein